MHHNCKAKSNFDPLKYKIDNSMLILSTFMEEIHKIRTYQKPQLDINQAE